MWWKIYFVFVLFDFFLAILAVLATPINFTTQYIINRVVIISLLILILGIYSYIFKKKYFSQKFWRVFFWVFIVVQITQVIFPLVTSLIAQSADFNKYSYNVQAGFILGPLILLPGSYAIYKLGYRK